MKITTLIDVYINYTFHFFFYDERKNNKNKKIDDANIIFNTKKKRLHLTMKKILKCFKNKNIRKFFFMILIV